MTENTKKKVNKKSVILGIGIIIIIGLFGTFRSNTVEKDGVYSIATIYKVQGARGGLRIDYRYIFENKTYTGYAVSSSYSSNYIGKKLFIQVLPNDPERCLITDIQVPGYLTEAPPEGWKELPIGISK